MGILFSLNQKPNDVLFFSVKFRNFISTILIPPRRDFLNNFIIRFLFIYFYSYPLFGDYTFRQCYKIVINELFEGKRKKKINLLIFKFINIYFIQYLINVD